MAHAATFASDPAAASHVPRGSLPPIPDLLSDREATAYLGLAPGTLAVWRSTGRYGLQYIKLGRCIRYRRSALDSFCGADSPQPERPSEALGIGVAPEMTTPRGYGA